MHHLLLLLPLLALILFVLLPWPLALPLYGLVLVVSLVAYWKALQAQRQPPVIGARAMIGDRATVVRADNGGGEVDYHGELWGAVSSQPLHRGQQVIIVGVEGLTLWVKASSTE